mgnify:CR=1 FL=1
MTRVYSELTKEWYDPEKVVRIILPKQYTLYLKYGCLPKDIYTSKKIEVDEETGETTEKDILVWVFDKASTYKVYQKWQAKELE